MKLIAWLEREGLNRSEFARRIGVSPATMTALCNSAAPWMNRSTASAIVRETSGEVGPNDFLCDGKGSVGVAVGDRPLVIEGAVRC